MLGIKELCRKQRHGCLNAFSMPGRPVLNATPMFIDPFFHHSNHPWDATVPELFFVEYMAYSLCLPSRCQSSFPNRLINQPPTQKTPMMLTQSRKNGQ